MRYLTISENRTQQTSFFSIITCFISISTLQGVLLTSAHDFVLVNMHMYPTEILLNFVCVYLFNVHPI